MLQKIQETAEFLRGKMNTAPETAIILGTGLGSGIVVDGIDNCLVRISHCCSPVPGDKIIGYVTRGRGVAVHRTDCINITNSHFTDEEQRRFINVHWSGEVESSFQATLCITAPDRNMLLSDITMVTSDLKIPIKGLNARTAKNNLAIIDIVIEVKNIENLDNAIKKLKNIDGVLAVARRRQ